ncbi:class D sortase [Salicibibacter halophilus]|uniref:Class D sortase n=1 Tax=Salicibibacter halophilus TaxID=2502791 RepID=A0A514LJM7_9BACI|nr:class D sortase [Salicibibacter halophilus]QDI92058.1 class D sortase [Salicibibacter halophilus]
MRKLGIVFIIIGLVIVSWFGYERWIGMQSVEEFEGDVVRASSEMEVSQENLSLDEEGDPPQTETTQNYEVGEGVAELVIPELNKAYETYWGQDEETLSGGVGMYDSEWTTTPEEGGHTVLSGHRDTVFQPVGDLNEGDSLYVTYDGVDYEYEIKETWITDKDDRSVIVEKEDPTLTLTTCYPFDYFGDAPERYIIQAELVNVGDLLKER